MYGRFNPKARRVLIIPHRSRSLLLSVVSNYIRSKVTSFLTRLWDLVQPPLLLHVCRDHLSGLIPKRIMLIAPCNVLRKTVNLVPMLRPVQFAMSLKKF